MTGRPLLRRVSCAGGMVVAPPRAARGALAYTARVRRWICIITLLAGFTTQDYVWAARSRPPTPTEQPYDRLPWRGPEVQPWDWWFMPWPADPESVR